MYLLGEQIMEMTKVATLKALLADPIFSKIIEIMQEGDFDSSSLTPVEEGEIAVCEMTPVQKAIYTLHKSDSENRQILADLFWSSVENSQSVVEAKSANKFKGIAVRKGWQVALIPLTSTKSENEQKCNCPVCQLRRELETGAVGLVIGGEALGMFDVPDSMVN